MQAETKQTPYEQTGGDVSVRKLVDRFYDLMDEKEDVKALREMHAKSLRVSREKLYFEQKYPVNVISPEELVQALGAISA